MASELWNAVVLAGDRSLQDPVAQAAKASCKAAASLAGVMLIERVLSALAQSKSINKIFVMGPQQDQLNQSQVLQTVFEKYAVTALPIASGPSVSAKQGVEYANYFPTLITTCDLPLIQAQHVEHYCGQMENIDADFVISAISHPSILQRVSELQKTTYKFNQEALCFANLFAVRNKQGLQALEFWRAIETKRKSPLKIIASVGWRSLLRYKLGRLSIEEVGAILSKQTQANIKLVNVACPELAIDVDSKQDYELLQRTLAL